MEQEFCSRSASFDWLADEERDLLSGPIAFDYKRLREYTEKGNVEVSLWKLANLVNVTLSYLFAAILEREQDLRNRLFNRNNRNNRYDNNNFTVGEKRREILRLGLGNELAVLLGGYVLCRPML